MNEFFKKRDAVTKILYILGVFLLALVIFQAGISVGYRKAEFSYRWNSAYMHGMNDPHSMLSPFMHDADDVSPHGAVGEIVSVRLPMIMIKSPYEAEKIISIGTSTMIRNFHTIASSSDLRTGQDVVVIGVPDDKGTIDATFIRIAPGNGVGTTSTMK